MNVIDILEWNVRREYNEEQKINVAIYSYSPKDTQLDPTPSTTFLPFEPTLIPKLQVYFADFPYLRYAI